MHVLPALLLTSLISGVALPAAHGANTCIDGAGAPVPGSTATAPATADSTDPHEADDVADNNDCSEPPAVPAVPAVIDCNDERASVLIGSMIGVCDMPRQSADPPAAAAARPLPPVHEGPTCNLLGCSDGSSPLRGITRASPGPQPFLMAAKPPSPHFVTATLRSTGLRLADGPAPPRLERPPRAS